MPLMENIARRVFWARTIGIPSKVLENEEEFRRDRAYILACTTGIIGVILGFFCYNLLLPYYDSMSAEVKLLSGLMPYQVFAFGGCLLGLIPCMLKYGFRRTFDIAWAECGKKRRVLVCIKYVVMLYPLVIAANYLSLFVLSIFDVEQVPQLISELSEEGTVLFWILSGITTVIIAPIAEEVMIRLVLYRTLRWICPLWACLLSSFVFAIMHTSPQYLLGLFIVGLFLQRARRIWGIPGSILLHCTYNLIAFLFLLPF